MSDPQKYRTKEEMEEYKGMDPITNVLKTIYDKKYASEAQIEEINTKVDGMIEEAVKFAEDSPSPKAEELYEDVYATPGYPFIKENL